MARQNTLDAADGQLSAAGPYPDSATGHIIGHTDGHMFTNTGKQLVELVATAAGTVTFPTPATSGGLAVADPSQTFAGAGRRLCGPFPPELFNQRSGADRGKMYIDFVTPASTSVKVYQLP